MARRDLPPDLRHRGPVRLLPGGLGGLLRCRAVPASSRATAVESVRLLDLPRELSMLGPNNYGKAEVRLVRLTRATDSHDLVDLNVSVALSGALEATHLTGDNSAVLPTDTQKNTVYAFAREGVDSPESFGLRLARHFVDSQ